MSSKVRSYAALFKVLNDDGFEGFVGDANHVLQQPQLVKEIIDMGYIFCTYGDPNNTYEGIEKQLQLGIRGICSDNMSLCRSVIDEYCRIHD
ncbi:hypothetical protein TRFO_39402 [Tritrichomonas foetus]|uniref:GP-PDE domain-containing protein n=1 Tax=Tritrichomonas foetus TaxID=1144522 RepID=A0A1J4J543_9EUKA|nr:hypothetical protein TRFO_39402 [Tritrichomonas foetus]|eukprot:OHS94414.1 hypothetical protein TRFO_39402 [Tritrichomonas foetus]